MPLSLPVYTNVYGRIDKCMLVWLFVFEALCVCVRTPSQVGAGEGLRVWQCMCVHFPACVGTLSLTVYRCLTVCLKKDISKSVHDAFPYS